MKRIGIKDVALHARVSISTVSMALNHPSTVSVGVRERVRSAADALGYIPLHAAQQLRARRSGLLGMSVINIANPFFAEMMAGAEEAATGLSVLVGNSDDDADRESEHLELFDRVQVEGALVAPFAETAPQLARLRARGIPVVLIDSVDELGQWPSVSFDNVAGGRMAAEHLIGLGRRRLAFLGAREEVRQVRERLHGAREAVADHNRADGAVTVTLDVTSIPRTTPDLGRTLGEQIASAPAGERPDGVMTTNDLLGCGVVHALVRNGVRVPEDVAVIGYDDISFAAVAAVPLTSIRQPAREMGKRASELLLAHINARNAGEHAWVAPSSVVFSPELIVRASTVGVPVASIAPSAGMSTLIP